MAAGEGAEVIGGGCPAGAEVGGDGRGEAVRSAVKEQEGIGKILLRGFVINYCSYSKKIHTLRLCNN